MSDDKLLWFIAASLLIHMALLPLATVVMYSSSTVPVLIPVQLADVPRVEEMKNPDLAPSPEKSEAQKITAPKLLSKPIMFDPRLAVRDTKEEIKEAAKTTVLSSGEVAGNASDKGGLFTEDDVGADIGSAVIGGGSGQSATGSSSSARTKGEGTGSEEGPTRMAHPRGGYQVKPRYPESARIARAQGTTLLKLRVLENGRVGEVLVEQSAGHTDLDSAAVEAVKKWLFEPARMGKEPVAVWVLLPVKFELQR